MLFHTGIFRNAGDITKNFIGKLHSKTQYLNRIHLLVDTAIDLLKDGNLDEFGNLLNETWHMKKNISKNISNNLIEEIYALAMSNGAIGGKLLGAGGGGFILFYVPEEKHKKIIKKLSGLVYIPFKFENFGSKVVVNQQNGW